MHVVMLSDMETTGGAAIAASRLAKALADKGMKISRIMGIGESSFPTNAWDSYTVFPNISGGYIPKLIEKCAIGSITRIYSKISERRIGALLNALKPDIINVHNIHGAGWLPEIISCCTAFAPVVWTLHDMWSFTGRCAYAYNCQLFMKGCDQTCPTAHEYPHTNRNNIVSAWKIREKLFSETINNLVAVTPSQWLAVEAQKGLWNGHQVMNIPNGLPLDLYRPLSRKDAKESLGISCEGPLMLAAAQYLFEKRKGGHILLETLQELEEDVSIMTFGMNKIEIQDKKHKIFNLGFVSESKKVLSLNAADFYVHPAPVDNLPNVVMESIACGTPVVGFDTGGVPEMVREFKTGWIASDISPASLAATIDSALCDVAKGYTMRDSCRLIAEKEYDVNLQAERYMQLFQSLLDANEH